MADWNTIIQGNISLLWIQECMKVENQEKTVKELINEYRSKNENVGLLNIGTLMMASYLFFVCPREQDKTSIDFSQIDLPVFTQISGTTKNVNVFVRRLRNSIAHANFEFCEENIILLDNNANGSDEWKVSLVVADFGNFLNDFMFITKNQYYRSKKRK
ncbi:MAG: HEPN family nuclease [Marinisporobacter sp.]|nr:HEPN family nuclease [Marinisporobacter sp.]